MNDNLAFYILYYTVDESNFPMPENENYDYWVPLIKYFLVKSDMIEFHSWNEEMKTIKELKSFFDEPLEIIIEDNLTIFKGNITPPVKDALLYNYLKNIGELKWFTVHLLRNSNSIFHSGHWGTEFFVPDVNEKDIEFIKTVTPKGTKFYQFQ